MKRKEIIFIIAIFSFIFISGCTQMETDVQLTRRAFNGLCSGNQRVEGLIDWQTFKAMGTDVGKAYSSIVLEKERRDYRKAFFYNVGFTFRASGGKVSGFSNWRVKNMVGNDTIVAADSAIGKTILLTLTNNSGKRKITAIDWQQ
jgi:hypothetical protein